MNAKTLRTLLALAAAFVCLAAGVLLERSLLEHVVIPDGEISSLRFRGLLFFGQLGCLGLAVWLYHKCEEHETLALSSAILIGACTLAGGILGLELLLGDSEGVSGWRSFSGKSEKNVLGFRGQPIEYSPEDYVIVLLGDSAVEAKACAYEWMPDQRLQHYLNLKGKRVKVFTVGAAGYGQDQELLALQEYLSRFRADLVVVWLTPGNDVTDNLWPTVLRGSFSYPKPTFRLQDGKLIGPTEQIGESLSLSRFAVLSRIRRLGVGDRDLSFEEQFPEPYTPNARIQLLSQFCRSAGLGGGP